jgi:membrane-associated phospholipid phosphatase
MASDSQLTLPASGSPAGLRLLWPIAIAVLGFAALPLDLPIAWWFHDRHCPPEINRWLQFSEVYAHGFGVVCILLTIFALDAGRRNLLPRVAAIAFGGGLLANLLKLSLVRARPHDFLAPASDDLLASAASASHRVALSIGDSFGQWLPLGNVTSGYQSFPSGHMATAFGLTAALIWLYPRGRWVFVFFALIAGCQRMSSLSHFLSDVVWGAAAGCAMTLLFLPGGLLASQFDRLEAFLRTLANRRFTSVIAPSTDQEPRRRDAA